MVGTAQPVSVQADSGANDSGSHINDMNWILGEEPESSEEVSQEATATEADSGEAQAAAPEAEAVEETATEPSGQSPKQLKEARIAELAKQYGLDPRIHRKVLEDFYAVEKRNVDGQDYIQQLKENDRWLTDFEKELQNPGQVTTAAKTEQPRPANGVAITDAPAFNDGYDHWKTPSDAATDLYAAWQAGDTQKAAQINQAVFTRQFRDSLPLLNGIFQRMLDERLNVFRDQELGEIIPDYQARKTAQSQNRAYDEAVADIGKDPARKALWEEMNKSSGTFDFNGQKYPDTPLNRIFAEFPGFLKVQVQHKDPKTAYRLTAIEQYRLAMGVYASRKRSAINPQTAAALVQAGAEQKTREIGKARAKQALNAGGTRAGQAPLSDDEQWIKNMSKSKGSSSGVSVQNLF